MIFRIHTWSRHTWFRMIRLTGVCGLVVAVFLFWHQGEEQIAEAQDSSGNTQQESSWIEEIQKVFLPSEQCKQFKGH